MVCRTCGRQVSNETANFCEYCGTSLRQMDDPFDVYSRRQEEPTTKRSWFGKEIENGKEPVVTFGQWLLLMVVLPLSFNSLISSSHVDSSHCSGL